MNINIKVSNNMSFNKETNNENKFLRMTEEYRAQCNVELGDFVNFKSTSGDLVTLQIGKIYINDLFDERLSAYVTNDTFELIDIHENIEIVNDITLGADPEYYLINKHTGKLIDASTMFNKQGGIGCDGLLAEIRPLPSTNPEVVTANIGTLLAGAKKIAGNDVSMVAASYIKGIAAGFHLHFGIPKKLLGKTPKISILISAIVRSLDYYLSPLGVVIEGEKESGRRSAPFLTYGKVSDYRTDFNTLEYRVPGGCFLRHPLLTNGLLSLGATIIEDAISRFKVFTNGFKNLSTDIKCNDIYPNIPNLTNLFKILCTPYSDIAKRCITNIREDVQKMLGYNKRLVAINALFDNIETVFDNRIDINWRLEQVQTHQKTFNMIGD